LVFSLSVFQYLPHFAYYLHIREDKICAHISYLYKTFTETVKRNLNRFPLKKSDKQ